MKVLGLFIANERNSKQRLDRANMLYKSAEFALQSKNDTNALQAHPLSDTVNMFELQYFPVLTADQSELIFTRRLVDGPNEDEDLVISRNNSKADGCRPKALGNINTP
ncbi:MAG: hypothetical protein QM762_06755 [Chryseolinea sp.]